MNFKTYVSKQKELFDNWTIHIEDANKTFVWDGVVAEDEEDYNIWLNSKSKILFLVKEAFGDFTPEYPTEDKKKFHLNMAKWKYLIDGFISKGVIPEYPSNEALSGRNTGIAIVEVKKFDDNSHSSNPQDILNYAKRDAKLLQTQIDLIDPNIIICCGTFQAYDKGIYFDDDNKILWEYQGIEENIDASIYTHRNRTILNFYHPSCRTSPEILYNLLGQLFRNRNKKQNDS